ncbi:MAG: DUF58 domain-containing protein [Lachnospiraceae bacterium]|nr:DUF58 domain-containing protein [Lachnospiraceae bacterium]
MKRTSNSQAVIQPSPGFGERRALRRRKWLGRIMSFVTSRTDAWISYVSLVLVSFALSAFYLQTFFYLISILLLSLPVFSYNLTRYAFNRLEPGLINDPPVCIKGGQSQLILTVSNPTWFPVSSAEITLNTGSLFYGGGEPVIHSLQLKPGKGNRLSFPVSYDKYGIYTSSITYITVYDYLHLFSFGRPLSAEASVTIMPDTPPREKRMELIYEEGFDEFTDNDRRGSVSSNVTDIREYRPGDRLSRIHWKLTEKLDKLIVKDNEATSSNEFTVLLELYQPDRETCERAFIASGGTDDSLYHVLDRAIEEAWSVSMELLNAGEAFRFIYYNAGSQDFTEQLIHSADDLSDIMTRAFYAGSYNTADLALTIYERAGLSKGTLIHVK